MNNKDIWIEGDLLFYKDHGNTEKANLYVLTYAYVQVLGDVPFLYIFADFQHYIATDLEGFDEVYNELTNRFKFDNDLFLSVCKSKIEDNKVKIYAKKMPRNFQILTDYKDDVELGYEVYSDPKQMVSWNIINDELERLGLVEAYFSDFGSKYLKFKYPVRIEDILIKQLEIYAKNVNNAHPVKEYFVKIYDETNTDKSYKELRELWLEDDSDIDDFGYERDDQCNLYFNITSGINASILYTYDSDHDYEDGSTSLHFYNKREYKHVLENKEYEESMEISDILSFQNRLDLHVKYIDNENVKHIPFKVKDLLNENSGVWVDRVNHKIGFVGLDTALILDINEIKYFTIQNVLPDRGPGYADLIIQLNTDNYLYIFNQETYFFDQFATRLREITEKSVNIPGSYYNS